DRQAFNHGSTNFPLDGKHQAVPCEKCHEKTGPDTAGRMQYTGLDYKSCINCHHNPHADPRASHCLECHTMQGWDRDNLTFDHDRDSQFPLLGAHAKPDCEKCHPRQTTNGRVQVRLFDVGKSCQDCHDDPHAGQMSSACSTCHTETGWTGNNLVFSHDKHSSFHLDMLHSSVNCDDCHGRQARRYRPLPHECGTCHTIQQAAMQGTSRLLSGPPDPHNGRLSCTDCHDLNTPRQRQEESAARCATCHNARYSALFYSWASALDQSSASIRQNLKRIDDPNDARRLQLEQILEDAAAAGFHNLNLTQEILRAGTPAHPENVNK
ncbi:MAG: hypothetical protein EHM35_08050, partial [Planctomycetaceae bacterium]